MTAGKKCSPAKKRTSSAPDKNPAPILAPTKKKVARKIPIIPLYMPKIAPVCKKIVEKVTFYV